MAAPPAGQRADPPDSVSRAGARGCHQCLWSGANPEFRCDPAPHVRYLACSIGPKQPAEHREAWELDETATEASECWGDAAYPESTYESTHGELQVVELYAAVPLVRISGLSAPPPSRAAKAVSVRRESGPAWERVEPVWTGTAFLAEHPERPAVGR